MTARDFLQVWMRDAACKGQAVDLFFEEDDPRRKALARRICASCPVATECLTHAHHYNEKGIRAGTTSIERQRTRSAVRAAHGIPGTARVPEQLILG